MTGQSLSTRTRPGPARRSTWPSSASRVWAQKGHQALRPPPFEVSGSFTLDQKKAKLLALKARTTCRKCDAVGHWSGDATCPLSKGKGKSGAARAGTSSSTSTSGPSRIGKGAPHGKGNPSAGRGGAVPKPRTVYFPINETADLQQQHNKVSYLAFRVPDHREAAHGGYHAVPPPADLREELAWQLSTQEMAATSTDATWVSRPMEEDQDMVMLIEALGHPENNDPMEKEVLRIRSSPTSTPEAPGENPTMSTTPPTTRPTYVTTPLPAPTGNTSTAETARWPATL